LTHNICDFDGRYIFAPPAEGISEAINKVKKPLPVTAHQVTSPIPPVAFCEYIPQNFTAGSCRVTVAVKDAARTQRSDRLSRLPDLALATEALGTTYGFARAVVNFD